MKKFLLAISVALLGISAQAQTKGDWAVGIKGGAQITKIDLGDDDDTSTNLGIGVFGQYNFAKNWRVELEGVYHPEKDHVSDFLLGLNLHYLIKVTDSFKVYPLLGYGLSFVHQSEIKENGITIEADDETDGGIQLGLGMQYNLPQDWFINVEYKYQPGLFGDGHAIMAGVGFRF